MLLNTTDNFIEITNIPKNYAIINQAYYEIPKNIFFDYFDENYNVKVDYMELSSDLYNVKIWKLEEIHEKIQELSEKIQNEPDNENFKQELATLEKEHEKIQLELGNHEDIHFIKIPFTNLEKIEEELYKLPYEEQIKTIEQINKSWDCFSPKKPITTKKITPNWNIPWEIKKPKNDDRVKKQDNLIIETPPTEKEKIEIKEPKKEEKTPKEKILKFEPIKPIEVKKWTWEFKNYPKELPKTWALESSEILKKWWLAGYTFRKLIDIKLPKKETFRLAWTNEKNLEKWLEILPKQDRNKDKYIVLPTQGLIMWINSVNKNDKSYQEFINWKNQNFYDYLIDWALEVPWTSINNFWEIWNKVIAWHSSYWKGWKSRYKTHFQKIIGMEKGEEIWIFTKNENWNFDKYIYKVTESYNTSKNDISILKPTDNKQLTLFTCTPIWGSHGRWIVKSEFIWIE